MNTEKQELTIYLDSEKLKELNELKENETLTNNWKFRNQFGEAITVNFVRKGK